MIEIIGTELNQWDVGRLVQITGIEAKYAHFANKGDSKAVIMDVVDKEAKIPDYLLQTGKPLCVYAVKNGITIESRTFYVKNRERPESYVYEDDQRNYIYKLISNAEQAVEDANLATENAILAAEGANTSVVNANVATENANHAAYIANEAANNANEAAAKAAHTAKSLMVVGNAEGSNIYLDDAIEQYLVGLRVFGKTTQVGTPTPYAPVDLMSVGGGGSFGVFVAGKNLLDLRNFADRSQTGASIINNKDGSITIVTDGTYTGYYNGAVTVSIPSGRYKFVEASSYRYAFVRLFAKGAQTYTQYNTGTVFEYDNSVQEMKFYVQCDPGAKVSATLWPMICLATETDNTYEPYKAQTCFVSTPNGLPGIPVTTGGNYTDANGQQWICDEIDFERGVYVKRVGVYEAGGLSDRNVVLNDKGNKWKPYPDICLYDSALNGTMVNAIYSVLNTKFPMVSQKQEDDDDVGAVLSVYGHGVYTELRFRLPVSEYETADSAAQAINGTVAYYPLVTHIESPLSAEELASYAALHTYRDNTTVSNDAGAYMEIEYVMDAKKYIDSMLQPPAVRIAQVKLLASAWAGSGNLYSQVVTIDGITGNSQVNLTPSIQQLAIFYEKNITFSTVNEGGVVTVYVIGQKPVNDYTIQADIVEVIV